MPQDTVPQQQQGGPITETHLNCDQWIIDPIAAAPTSKAVLTAAHQALLSAIPESALNIPIPGFRAKEFCSLRILYRKCYNIRGPIPTSGFSGNIG